MRSPKSNCHMSSLYYELLSNVFTVVKPKGEIVKKLNLLNLRIDGGTQPRKELDQDMVKDYAEKMREGVVFPALVAFHDGSDYWLVDGFHRYFSYKTNGIVSVDVEVHSGTLRDAKLYSFGANGKHGKPPTAEDKRNSILEMLMDEEWGKWSNVEIAKIVNVSSMTVGRVRISYQEANKVEAPSEKKYIDRHGNESVMKVKNLSREDRKLPKPDTSKVVVEQEQLSGLNDKIDELSHTINDLADENTLLRDKIAIGQWDATEIEKIDAKETIDDLREQVRVLEIDNKALRDSRDMYQSRNSELMKTVKSLTAKLKKA